VSSDAPATTDAAVEAAFADADADAPLSEPNLVAAWFFDEPSGTTANDATGHGHEGTLQGGAAFTPSGLRGGAVAFAGGADSVTMTSLNGAAFPRTGTLSVHFRYDFTDTLNRAVFDTFNDTRDHLFLRRANNAPVDQFQVAGQYADGGGGYAFVHSFTVAANTWTHVVVTWSEASQAGNVYVDGALAKNQGYGGPYAPSAQLFRLGVSFIGIVDEVRLYDRALSATEVAAIP
jgi:hypothetical protein